jgi:hypothetical protein
MTLAELARALVRTEAAVRVKAHKMGLSVRSHAPAPAPAPDASRRPWSRDEDLFLYSATKSMSLREAGRRLGRTKASVHHRCRRLGIRWTQGRRSIREVALDLGCHPSYVRCLAAKIGVTLPAPKGGGMLHVKDEVYEKLCAAWLNPPSVGAKKKGGGTAV